MQLHAPTTQSFQGAHFNRQVFHDRRSPVEGNLYQGSDNRLRCGKQSSITISEVEQYKTV